MSGVPSVSTMRFVYWQATVAFAILCSTIYMGVLAHDLREAQAQMRADREDDVKRAKLLDDARDKEILQAAELIVKGKENIRLAKELNQLLRGD